MQISLFLMTFFQAFPQGATGRVQFCTPYPRRHSGVMSKGEFVYLTVGICDAVSFHCSGSCDSSPLKPRLSVH